MAKRNSKSYSPPKPNRPLQSSASSRNTQTMEIQQQITQRINNLAGGFKDYSIRDLVKDAEQFGPYLKQQRLETNQIRKFLDAINQLKTTLAQNNDFSSIETGVVLLKPKLAYAAARQSSVKPLSEVMSKAIDKVKDTQDFERLVNFIESIIAYHKAEGGR